MTSIVQRRLALALGDPHGIGPEIALKALLLLSPAERKLIKIYGPWAALEAAAHICGLQSQLQELAHEEAGTLPEPVRWGSISSQSGRSAIESATAALQACENGEVDAVIACPHHETAVHRAGISFSGYPSLVAKVLGMKEDQVFLMLVGAGLRIVHVTLHESVRTALDRLSPQLIERAVHAAVQTCALLGVLRPSVALFGINPHASEGQLFGLEDAQITVPAMHALRASGLDVDGPLGADMLLAQRKHDLYVAMLHDQGHIPIKLLAPNASSALSIGGRVVLSSVGHGSAMDIAGRGVADPTALLRTIALLGTRVQVSS